MSVPIWGRLDAVMLMKPIEADWIAIKSSYISGISLARLAEMYGVNRSTIANHAASGGWREMREQAAIACGVSATGRNTPSLEMLFARDDAPQDAIETITSQCLRIVKTGLDKIEAGMGNVDPKDAGTIRSYCSSMKDLQTVAGAFAGLTRQEIAARIEQIQRQRQIDEEYGTGIVMIPAVQEASDG